jgi:hypothetical protein
MNPRFLAACALLFVTLPACGGDSAGQGADALSDSVGADADVTPDASDSLEHAVGEWRVRIDPDACTWSVRPADASAPLLAGPAGCQSWLSLATGGAPTVEQLFGAYQIDLDTLTMASPSAGARPLPVPFPGALEVRLDVGNTQAILRFEARSDGALRVALVAPGVLSGVLRFAVGADESFFGLGTQSVAMDLRGRRFPLWTQEQGIGKPEGGGLFPLNNIPEAAYAPMGVWHSTAGYSAVLAIDAYTELDLNTPTGTLRSHGELPAFALISGATPRERLRKVTSIIGRIDTPPAWMFAPWNDAVGGPERLRAGRHRPCATTTSPPRPSGARTGSAAARAPAAIRLSLRLGLGPRPVPRPARRHQVAARPRLRVSGLLQPLRAHPRRDVGRGRGRGLPHERRRGSGPTSFPDPAVSPRQHGRPDQPGRARLAVRLPAHGRQDLGIDGWMADFAEWLPTDAILRRASPPGSVHNPYPAAVAAGQPRRPHGGGTAAVPIRRGEAGSTSRAAAGPRSTGGRARAPHVLGRRPKYRLGPR